MLTGTTAEIIEFPHRDGRTARKRRNTASAQVIIFPGVRIERREFSLGDRLPRGGRKLASRSTTAAVEAE